MSGDWIDISVVLEDGIVHWPGDVPFTRPQQVSMSAGDEYNLSSFSASTHAGTHVDAPSHFLNGGQSVEHMPMSAMIGPARVIEIQDPEAIHIHELEAYEISSGEHILFKTSNSERKWAKKPFREDYVHIPPDTADYLAARRVTLVGIDYLSIGPFDQAAGAKTHRTLLGAGVWVLEGLNLTGVVPGGYDLICLPLRMAGAEASPARVILRKSAP